MWGNAGEGIYNSPYQILRQQGLEDPNDPNANLAQLRRDLGCEPADLDA